jgi:hypothetical protein
MDMEIMSSIQIKHHTDLNKHINKLHRRDKNLELDRIRELDLNPYPDNSHQLKPIILSPEESHQLRDYQTNIKLTNPHNNKSMRSQFIILMRIKDQL